MINTRWSYPTQEFNFDENVDFQQVKTEILVKKIVPRNFISFAYLRFGFTYLSLIREHLQFVVKRIKCTTKSRQNSIVFSQYFHTMHGFNKQG